MATLAALTFIGASPATAATSRVAYDGSKPAWAVAKNDSGTPAADTSVEGEIFLTLRNEAQATKLAQDVSSPTSRSYRHFVSPQAWISQFSPTKAALNNEISYLQSKGLTITGVPADRGFVVFRGSAEAVGSAFATTMKKYSVEGRTLLAPSTAPSLPTSVASGVTGVIIDQTRALTHPDLVKKGDTLTSKGPKALSQVKAVNPTPTSAKAVCSQYAGQHTVKLPEAYGKTVFPTAICGYQPSQLRAGYGLTQLNRAGINGRGQTVAIIDAYASPSIQQDTARFNAEAGEPQFQPGQYRQIVPQPSQFQDEALCQEPSGWQTEQTLDVETVHGVAPGANVLYVGGNDCEGGLDLALTNIVDNGLANIVSNSYSDATDMLPADYIAGENDIYLQAVAEGIGLYFSTGDDGDLTPLGETPQPSFPGTDQWVTGVGGTSLGITKTGGVAYETVWGDVLDKVTVDANGDFTGYTDPLPGTLYGGGGGGGVSLQAAEPWYQKGVVPASLSNGMRVQPDISALGDPETGYQIGYRPIVDDSTLALGPYENDTYGGTSLASPLFAAEMAVTQQATHSRIGFANPTLYGLYKVAPELFRDVTSPKSPLGLGATGATSGNTYLISIGQDTSLTATRGYDDATGLGELSYSGLTGVAYGRH